ncbi:MAG: heparinase II/III family protein [Verrucomicrobiae bacterium]|nr:heparinase II/III family protein [Verrucomicrobiae bacterium]
MAAPAGAAVYPKPNPEKAFPEMKLYDARGRSWRVAQEDWDGARRRVTADAGWADWLKRERAEVDTWMGRHRDRVEWVAGWSNDFISPKDGTKLTWTEAIPGEETDHFFSPSDPRVEITPKLKAAWVREFRERHAEMMERAARLYRLTGERRYAEWAAGQLDFYATHYLEWEPQRQGARLFWQALTEGVNLVTYAHTARLLGDFASTERKRTWREKFFEPEVAVLRTNFPTILNITCWLRGAAAQVGLIFGDEAMWREAVDGPFGVRQQVAEGITSDYLWFEQSLGYNNLVVDAFQSLFVTAGLYGRADALAHEMAVVENLMLAPLYLRFPNGQLPNPSDAKGIQFAPNRELFARLYRVFPTALGLQEAAAQRNWDTLLDPPTPSPPGRAELPPVTSRHWESSRFAVLKSGPWQVFLHYGQPPVKSHLQAEVLNFSAFYEDVDVTHDPGTTGYSSELHRDYFSQGLNHNVPLINGEGQEQPPKGRKPDPFTETRAGRMLEFSTQPPRMTAEQAVYRRGVRAARTLAIEGATLRDRVEVTSENRTTPQALGLALHLQGKVRLPGSFEPDAAFAEGRPAAFGFWSGVRKSAARDRATFEVDFGRRTLRVTFLVPGEFTIWHGSTPDVPPSRREGFYLETRGTNAVFTTLLEPVSGGRP